MESITTISVPFILSINCLACEISMYAGIWSINDYYSIYSLCMFCATNSQKYSERSSVSLENKRKGANLHIWEAGTRECLTLSSPVQVFNIIHGGLSDSSVDPQACPRFRTWGCTFSTPAPPWRRAAWSPAAGGSWPSLRSGRHWRRPCRRPIGAWRPSASRAPCTAATSATAPSPTWTSTGVCESSTS